MFLKRLTKKKKKYKIRRERKKNAKSFQTNETHIIKYYSNIIELMLQQLYGEGLV